MREAGRGKRDTERIERCKTVIALLPASPLLTKSYVIVLRFHQCSAASFTQQLPASRFPRPATSYQLPCVVF